MKFDVVMPTSSMDGYGYSGEGLVLAAKRLGADVRYMAHDWREPIYSDPKLLELEITEYDNTGIVVVYFIPYAFHHFRARFQIGQTMFETTEIPDTWARFCSIPNGLIVPSEFCKEVFQKKVDKPIEVVPLGVEDTTYFFLEREPVDTFTFLMAGLLHYRKGVDIAVRAFKAEFSDKENVRLVLKTRKGFLDVGDESIDHPNIEVVNWDYSREEMLDLYHAADCFIACSRGEASGLTPREAMATGLPTIATDWGGLTELKDMVYPLRIDGETTAPVECSSYSWGITQGEPIGNFSVPSVSHLRELMRQVYENREVSLEKGRVGAQWIRDEFSYNMCASKWLKAIERLYEQHR